MLHPGRVRSLLHEFVTLSLGNKVVDLICHERFLRSGQFLLPDITNRLVQTQALCVLIFMLMISGQILHRIKSLIILVSVLLSVNFLHQQFKQSRIEMIIKNDSVKLQFFVTQYDKRTSRFRASQDS